VRGVGGLAATVRGALPATLVATLALVPACASRTASRGVDESRTAATGTESRASTFVYECPDGFSYIARIEGDTARIFIRDRAVALPRVQAASGAKYADGTTTFWSKGDEALLEVGAETHRACASNRAKAIWEDARLRGVEFRALGQEPGWFLEIMPGGKLVFVTNYGTERHEFVTPDPIVGPSGESTVYRARDAGHELTVLVENRPRRDPMSGELFEATVTVTLDGRTHRGCGRALR